MTGKLMAVVLSPPWCGREPPLPGALKCSPVWQFKRLLVGQRSAPKSEEVAAHADAYLVALTRISGIVGGVLVMLLLSVIIFPKSASHQVQYGAAAPILPA